MWTWFSVRDLIFGTERYRPDDLQYAPQYADLQTYFPYNPNGLIDLTNAGPATVWLYRRSVPGSPFDRRILTGNDDDVVFVNGDHILVSTGGGRDYISVVRGSVLAVGGAGHDTLSFEYPYGGAVQVNLAARTFVRDGETSAVAGIEEVHGTRLGDILKGDDFGNALDGGLGNDTISGAGGRDVLTGGGGSNSVAGGNETDFILTSLRQNDGSHATRTSFSSDSLYGGSGNDVFYLYHSPHALERASAPAALRNYDRDVVFAGPDDDYVFAEASGDYIDGGAGVDTLDYGIITANTPLDPFTRRPVSNEGVHIELQITTTGDSDGLARFAAVGGDNRADRDVFREIEIFRASHVDDTIVGNGTSRAYVGRGGDDRIDGGASSFANGSVIVAGEGNDTVEAHGDGSLIFLGEGADKLMLSVGHGEMDIVFDFDPSEDRLVLNDVMSTRQRALYTGTTAAHFVGDDFAPAMALASRVIAVPHRNEILQGVVVDIEDHPTAFGPKGISLFLVDDGLGFSVADIQDALILT